MTKNLAQSVPACRVKLDGQPLSPARAAALARSEVELDTGLFGLCRLHFVDPERELIDGEVLRAGTAVEVELGLPGRPTSLFSGEVVALEPQFRRDQPAGLVATCYDPLHRLALAQMTRALNDVHDGQVAQAIAQRHGLSAEGGSGTALHSLQANVSDLAFLRRLAQSRGDHVRLEGTRLVLGPPPRGPALTLRPGEALRRVRVKIRAQQQVSEVTLHGWDEHNQREIVGRARSSGDPAEHASRTLSLAGHHRPPPDAATAEAMARGRLQRIAQGFVEVTAELSGDARAVPGAELSLERLGPSIDGRYRVEHAAHIFDRHGYRTSLRAVRVGKPRPPPKVKGPPPEPQPGWLEVELIDHEGQPIGGQRYRVQTADGRVVEGVLDGRGKARVEGVRPGAHTVTFPGFEREWERR
jgi:phage protein D